MFHEDTPTRPKSSVYSFAYPMLCTSECRRACNASGVVVRTDGPGGSSHPCREAGEFGPILSIVFMVLLARVRRKLNKDPPLKLRIWGGRELEVGGGRFVSSVNIPLLTRSLGSGKGTHPPASPSKMVLLSLLFPAPIQPSRECGADVRTWGRAEELRGVTSAEILEHT